MVVANRSSQSGVSSVVVQKTMHGFDLHSWQGLTSVLKAAREARLPDGAYNALRDAVLRYAQSGGGEEERSVLEKHLAVLSKGKTKIAHIESTVTPKASGVMDAAAETSQSVGSAQKQVLEKQSSESAPLAESRFYSGRPSPRFDGGRSSLEQTSTEQVSRPHVVSEQKGEPPVNLPTGDSRAIPKSQSEPKQVSEEISTVNTPSVAENTNVPAAPTVESTEKKEEEVIPKMEESTSVIKDSASSAFSGDTEEAKKRIAEIKHEVNEKVGNPVMLIDEGNNIGREYMGALLTATKATAGGPQGSLASAMDALESAYARILEHAPAHTATANKTQATTPSPASESTDAKKKLADEPEQEAQPVTLDAILAGASSRVSSKRIDTKQESAQSKPADPALPVSEEKSSSVKEADKDLLSGEASAPTSVNAVPLRKEASATDGRKGIPSLADLLNNETKTDRVVRELRSEENTNKENTYPVIPPKDGEKQSVAEAVGDLPVVSRLKRAEAMETPVSDKEIPLKNKEEKEPVRPSLKREDVHQSVRKAPSPVVPTTPSGAINAVERHTTVPVGVARSDADLMTPEVTGALGELLNEWNIFKKSGLLGFGPGGFEHPLYLELRDLHMSSVLAGRWEGSNKDDLLSIKDYVSSWQYEQGVAYNPSETFEHYLRRVVFKILKRRGG